MKKLIILSIMILLLSGCSVVQIESQSIDEIINTIITGEAKLKSVSLDGYSYYLPQGVSLNNTDHGNSILYYNHQKMYLYIDLISYYHKVDSTYSENDTSYYSKKIEIGGKQGYLEITKIKEHYFVEFMYHYSKMEAYVTDYANLKKTITLMAYILNNVQFQDSVIESLIGTTGYDYHEEQFNIFQPNGETSDFLDFVEQYDDGRKNSRDEDILELEEKME